MIKTRIEIILGCILENLLNYYAVTRQLVKYSINKS